MPDFLLAADNLPFTVALAVMLLLLAVETIGFVAGLGVSDWLHAHLPEFGDADGAEVAGSAAFADRFLGWLMVGRVPALILLAVFLSVFGLLGLGLQGALRSVLGQALPGWIAALAVFPLSLPFVRLVALGISRVLPRDETEVASRRSLLGHVGTIVIGTARRGSPAQAKVRDEVGQTQYVMVEPEHDDEVFTAGEPVLLRTQRAPAVFGVTRPDPALLP
jgi:hypothetical protein